MSTRPIVTFLTDYGPDSEHVGALHAVVAAACPTADRINLAHDIRPGDVVWAAIQFDRLTALLPQAVHCAVVDPGVGTHRRGVAVRTEDGGFLVGPDNGLVGLAAESRGADAAVLLDIPHGTPPTFHGRDVFAPAAAALASGVALEEVGDAIDPHGLAWPELPEPETGAGRVAATVAGSDRFGNVGLLAGPSELNAAGFEAGDAVRIEAPDAIRPATVGRTFADVAEGKLMVYIDSHGMLALAVNGQRASDALGLEPGERVVLERVP